MEWTEPFVEGFLLGIGAAVPLGPINVMIMNMALRSYSRAFSIGLGAVTSDITYLVLILFGFMHFLNDPEVKRFIGYAGIILLLFIGWSIWKNRNETIKGAKIDKASVLGSYIKGYTLTLLNPYTLIFWFSVSTYIATKQSSATILIAGLFLSTTLWVTLMPLAIHKTRHLISQRLATLFSSISSIILLFFAIGMLWNLLK